MEYTPAKIKDILVEFLKTFKDQRNDLKYRTIISQLPSRGGVSIVVDYPDLLSFNTEIATNLVKEPDLYLKAFDEAAVETLAVENPIYSDKARKEIHVRIRELTDPISLRDVAKLQLNTLIMVRGMVVRSSELRPLAVVAAFRCTNQHVTLVEQSGVVLKRPVKCETEGCGENKSFELDELKTEFIDFQIIRIQELPEELPPGQLPQTFDVHLVGDVVNSARPGDRIILTGIVKAESEFSTGAGKLRLFTYRIEGNFVDQLGKSPEETEITREEEEQIKTLASLPGAYDRLINSVAPAIYGHELHKEAALLLMVGSKQKSLPDGSTLRGDINCLLVGDPGCLVADERIVLGNGAIAKIGNVGSRHLQSIHVELQTGRGFEKAIATTFHKYTRQKIIEILTESGKSLKGTLNHPVLARKRESRNEKEWRRLDQVKLGDKIEVSPEIPCTIQNLVKTNFQLFDFGSDIEANCDLPEFMTEDLAAFCGYMTGDGWVWKSGGQTAFVVTEESKDILPSLLSRSKTLFGIEPNVRERKVEARSAPSYYITIKSASLAQNIAFLNEKRIPDAVLFSRNDIASSYLQWLYEADGHVSIFKHCLGMIALESNHVELLRDIQVLLLRFGIHSRIVEGELEIRRADSIIKFASGIGFVSKYKRAALTKLSKQASSSKNLCTPQTVERVVKIIQHPTEDVFDVEVPGAHRFIANGIISHNTAKSELLKYVARVAPRALYTSGRGTTAAGLTAAVVREKNGMLMLEAGATVLADLGIAIIDEFDKMRKDDRDALHEVMEQQTASVAKGGFIATLNARTSIFAAANPVFGKYDPYKNILDNVNLPVPLLTRFDLVFIVKDEPDAARDEVLAKHVLDMHAKLTFPKTPPIEFGMLKKYIIYAKKLDPELTEEARKRLSDYYIELRRLAQPGQIAVTPRWLEGLIRLSTARARVLLHLRVTEDDALRAVGLMKRMLETVAIDQNTGGKQVDVGVLYGKPLSERNLLETALETFKKLEGNGPSKQPVEDKAFMDELVKTGKFNAEEADKMLKTLYRSGQIYEIKPHFYKRI